MPEQPQKDLQRGGPFEGDDEAPPVLPGGSQGEPLPACVELHCLTNFSFQRGASHPHELVQRAYNLGYEALAITDECSVAGVVRAYAAFKELNLPQGDPFQLIPGSEFRFDGFRLVALPHNENGWGNLCEFITAARREARKGEYIVNRDASDFSLLDDCEILLAPSRDGPHAIDAQDHVAAGFGEADVHRGGGGAGRIVDEAHVERRLRGEPGHDLARAIV